MVVVGAAVVGGGFAEVVVCCASVVDVPVLAVLSLSSPHAAGTKVSASTTASARVRVCTGVPFRCSRQLLG
jgi:hypothetical protein